MGCTCSYGAHLSCINAGPQHTCFHTSHRERSQLNSAGVLNTHSQVVNTKEEKAAVVRFFYTIWLKVLNIRTSVHSSVPTTRGRLCFSPNQTEHIDGVSHGSRASGPRSGHAEVKQYTFTEDVLYSLHIHSRLPQLPKFQYLTVLS